MKIKSGATLLAVSALFQTAAVVTQTRGGNGLPIAVVTAAAAQTMNPAYLSEMPAVERVQREIQGTNAEDTALRQKGAFWQLQEIIRTLAGLRDPDQLTPDERKLKQAYDEAGASVSQAFENTLATEEEKRKWRNRSPYMLDRTDRRFGVEDLDLFKRFFSPAFRAAFDGANAAEAAKHKAFEQAQIEAQKAAQAQEKAAQAELATQGQQEREVARCLASGRPGLECVSDVMGKGFKELTGIMDPSTNQETATGLRLNGAYAGSGGLSLEFHPSLVAVNCSDARRDDRYTVEIRGNQIVVSVESEPKPWTVALTPDGSLSGSGTISVKGMVRTGTRHFTDGTTEPIVGVGTRTCTPGLMPSTGAATVREVNELLRSFDPPSKKPAVPLGLRMNGVYAGAGVFSVEFHEDSAVVGCGEVAIAQPYTVERQASQVQVTIPNSPEPLVFTLGADGSLRGSGSVVLNGRVVVGVTGDANDPIAYQPRTASCNAGILSPAKRPQGEAEAGAAAARAALNIAPPSGPGNVSTPVKPAGPAEAAVLSVVSGFSAQGGAANPLAGIIFFLLKESLETALTKTGFPTPQGMPVIQGWVAECNNGRPVCLQAVEAAVTSTAAALIQADATGRAQFAAVPAGTYYLFVSTRYNNRPIVWNLRVALGPGAHSVTLDQRNAAQTE